jgi:hypothetical protein
MKHLAEELPDQTGKLSDLTRRLPESNAWGWAAIDNVRQRFQPCGASGKKPKQMGAARKTGKSAKPNNSNTFASWQQLS